jgi:hypothetical protein
VRTKSVYNEENVEQKGVSEENDEWMQKVDAAGTMD